MKINKIYKKGTKNRPKYEKVTKSQHGSTAFQLLINAIQMRVYAMVTSSMMSCMSNRSGSSDNIIDDVTGDISSLLVRRVRVTCLGSGLVRNGSGDPFQNVRIL